MKKMYALISAAVSLLLIAASQPIELYPFSSSHQVRLFSQLTHEIRCLVCQNQNIADSNAPLAEDLRNKIYRMIQSNQSEANIKAYLEKRYGEFIFFKPPLNAHTALLWFFPFIGLIFIVILIIRLLATNNRCQK